MNPIIKVFSQFPNLEVTNFEHDITKLMIEFRIRHENWSLIMENISKMMPDVILAKRYFSEGGEFGFRWIILKIGNYPEEYLEELAKKIQYVLFEMPLSSKAPQQVQTRRPNQPAQKNKNIFTKIYEGEDGNVMEEFHFPLPHVTGEVGAPREGGAGVYKKATDMIRNLGMRKA